MNARQKALLRAVITKRSPEHMELIDALLSDSIDNEGRCLLSRLVNEEFLAEGIDPNDPDFSPNSLGNELESLIDAIYHKVWWVVDE
ncbi:hypothetical protein KMZ15_02400 [Mycoavidus sp. HKI]|uniref:hypothetical protein n=1 Tax=Mycoavidus sp. HKI TaxID=2840467 RepID=UPI001CBDA052|nr:hypothetical protein [Mycoavidus sp. HKI]UAW64552.1 hypothetical protein KMZ15_02400 [Mycoavidus sp. HKI]